MKCKITRLTRRAKQLNSYAATARSGEGKLVITRAMLIEISLIVTSSMLAEVDTSGNCEDGNAITMETPPESHLAQFDLEGNLGIEAGDGTNATSADGSHSDDGRELISDDRNCSKELSTDTAESRASPPISVAAGAPCKRLGVQRMKGGDDTRRLVTSLISEDDWRAGGNRIPYNHLSAVARSGDNFVYIGRLSPDGEACSVFAFHRTGARRARAGTRRDATVTMLWTKGPCRRRGIAKALMGAAAEELLDGAGCLISGTRPTVESARLYRSLDFTSVLGRRGTGDGSGFCIAVSKLAASLRRHAQRMEEGGWEMNIRLWDAHGSDLPPCLEGERDEWDGGRGVIDLTRLPGDEDDEAGVDVLFVKVINADPHAVAVAPEAAKS